jgi:DNA cross-link repair 1A protein
MKRCSKTYGIGLKDLLKMLLTDSDLIENESTDEDEEALTQRSNDQENREPLLKSSDLKLKASASLQSTSIEIVSLIDSSDEEPETLPVISSKPKVNAFDFMMNASKTNSAKASNQIKSQLLPQKNFPIFDLKKTHEIETLNNIPVFDEGFIVSKKRKTNLKSSGNTASSKRAMEFYKNETNTRKILSAPAYKIIRSQDMSYPIVVDGFTYASKQLSDCYFLTHFHSDHYTGLQKDFDCGRIFCSPTTASLIRLKIKPSQNCIIPLELEKEVSITAFIYLYI